MPPKRKGAAAKKKIKAPPTKTKEGEKKIRSEKTPNELPDQGTSSGTATFKHLEKPAEELDAEEFKQFLKQNTELLKLYSDLRGRGYEEVAWDMEQWIRFYEFNALVCHTMEGPGREKNKFQVYMEPPSWLDCTSSTMVAASSSPSSSESDPDWYE